MLIFKVIGRKNAKDSLLHTPKEVDTLQIDDLCSAFKVINIDNYKAAFLAKQAEDESDEFQELKKLVCQKYISNFSLFQSVSDM
jgi:arginine decarboxylase